MKNHIKAARAHFAFAAFYVLPLAALLATPYIFGIGIDPRAPGFVTALALAHLLIGWGAWRAHNWARLVTLALAFPALLAVPLGTLVAILLISYCWPVWDGARSSMALPGVPATGK